MKSLPCLRHVISISSLYPPMHTGKQSGRSPGMVLTGGRNERETMLQEIVLPFVQSVNKHCTDRPCQELRRKLPACDNMNYGCSGEFSSGRSKISVPVGKKMTLTDILHNFPQPFEETSGTLPARFFPNSIPVHCLFISVLSHKRWQHCS